MKAVVLDAPAPIERNPLRIVEMDPPAPGPGELVVRVSACGVCRSNLHMIEGEWQAEGIPAFLPIIPGHEVVGTVAQLGSGVDCFKVGERVGVPPLWSTCGHCEYCLSGRDELCHSRLAAGENVHGGYAEYMLAKAAHTYAVPENIGDATAAPLFCPGITAYGAITKAHLGPGRKVAIFGIGGVGHMALQFAVMSGAEVIAITRGRQHLQLASELGARSIDATTARPEEELVRAGGMHSSIICAPSTEVLRQAIEGTKRGGTVVVTANAQLGPFPVADEKQIVGSMLGSRSQMREVLEIAATGKIRAVCDVYPLDQANEVLQRLKRGEVRARAVLVT